MLRNEAPKYQKNVPFLLIHKKRVHLGRAFFRAGYPTGQKRPKLKRMCHGWQSRPTDRERFGMRGKLDQFFHIETTKQTKKNVMKKQLLLTEMKDINHSKPSFPLFPPCKNHRLKWTWLSAIHPWGGFRRCRRLRRDKLPSVVYVFIFYFALSFKKKTQCPIELKK